VFVLAVSVTLVNSIFSSTTTNTTKIQLRNPISKKKVFVNGFSVTRLILSGVVGFD